MQYLLSTLVLYLGATGSYSQYCTVGIGACMLLQHLLRLHVYIWPCVHACRKVHVQDVSTCTLCTGPCLAWCAILYSLCYGVSIHVYCAHVYHAPLYRYAIPVYMYSIPVYGIQATSTVLANMVKASLGLQPPTSIKCLCCGCTGIVMRCCVQNGF